MAVISDTVWCDPCLAPLVKALNDGGLTTVASCCGHGRRLGSVALADGRWLVLVPDRETFDRLAVLPAAITGVAMGPPELQNDMDRLGQWGAIVRGLAACNPTAEEMGQVWRQARELIGDSE